MAKIIAVMIVALVAVSGYAGESATFRLDTMDGPRTARAVETIVYSTEWNGGHPVSVAVDGVVIKEALLLEEGDVVWNAAQSGPGTHTLTHTCGGETLTAVFEVASDVVVHFNANGGVFRRSDGTTTNRFDQYFTYGVPQKLFTDELVPLKPDENGNVFLGWVRGTPNVYPDSDIIDGREEKTWYEHDGVTEVTYYAVWSSTVTVVFCNSGHDLIPASLSDHLKWRVVGGDDTWRRSGDSVQVPPGRQTIFLDYDAAYGWVAGEFQIDSSDYYAQCYDSETRRLTLDIDNDHRNDYYQTVEVGHTFYVKVGPPQGQICNVFFRCAGETIPDQTFDAADVNITLTYYGPSGNDRGVDLPGFSAVEAGKSYYLPYGVYDVMGKSRDGKWVAPTIPRLALAKDHKDVYLNFAYQPGSSLSGSKITLNPCGGTVDPTEIYVYDLKISQLPIPEHSWREFRGWWTQKDGKGRKVVPGTRLYAGDVPDLTLYAHWETIPERIRSWIVGTSAVKTSSIDGTTVVTLTSDVSGTIEIPDNISALTIDLNGHSIIGDGGALGESALPGGPAIRIVSGDGDGETTSLVIVDTSEGEKGQVVGGGESAGIEVDEDAAPSVRLDVDDGIAVLNGDGTEQEWNELNGIHIPGYGKVTVPKTWKVGQKVTWKATAEKGSVFAHWEGDVVDSLGLSRNMLRNPSLQFTVPSGFDTNGILAVFIAVDDDRLGSLALSVARPLALNADVAGIELLDDSESYVTASVSGLPTGLKFDAKNLAITGKPTKAGAFTVKITAKNAAGYQWAENVVLRVADAAGNVAPEPAVVPPKRTAYYPLTVVSTNTVAGTVTGTGVYADGKKVSVSAKPAKGYVFAGWYRDPKFADPMAFAAGDFLKASQSVVVPETRYLFAKFITDAEDKAAIGLAVDGIEMAAGAYRTNIWCGVYLEWPVAASALSEVKVKVAGLPAGLKFTDKPVTSKIGTGKTAVTVTNVPAYTIYGAPTAASKAAVSSKPPYQGYMPSQVKITVTTAGKSSQTYQIDAVVDALPEWAQGAYSGGFIETALPDNGGHAGRVTLPCGTVSLTVDAKGKISGKALGDGLTYTLAAPYYSAFALDENQASNFLADVTASWSYKEGAKTIKTNEVIRLVVQDNGIGGVVTGGPSAVSAAAAGDGGGEWLAALPELVAWQYNWKVEPWKALGKKFDKATMAYAILADGSFSDDEEDLASALGADVVGRVSLKFAATGAVTIAGEFVTGFNEKTQKYTTVKASGSATLVPVDKDGGYVFVYLTPKGLLPHARCIEVPWQQE